MRANLEESAVLKTMLFFIEKDAIFVYLRKINIILKNERWVQTHVYSEMKAFLKPTSISDIP